MYLLLSKEVLLTRYRMCPVTGKVGHFNYADAKKRLRNLLRSGSVENSEGQNLKIYKCPFCKYFHYGNQLREDSGKRRRSNKQKDRDPVDYDDLFFDSED